VEWKAAALSVVSPRLILLKSFRRSGQDQDDIQYLRSILMKIDMSPLPLLSD